MAIKQTFQNESNKRQKKKVIPILAKIGWMAWENQKMNQTKIIKYFNNSRKDKEREPNICIIGIFENEDVWNRFKHSIPRRVYFQNVKKFNIRKNITCNLYFQ